MASRPPQPAPTELENQGSPLLLIIGEADDTNEADPLSQLLIRNRFIVEKVSTPDIAIARLLRGGITVALLHVNARKMCGRDACKKIKDALLGRFCPVILVGEKSGRLTQADAFKCGADDFIAHPLNEEEALQRLNGLIRQKRMRDGMASARWLLEKVSDKDDVTGLSQLRCLGERLSAEFARAEKEHDPLSCCLFDVDRLKAHNEKAGRTFGDGILRAVADILRKAMGQGDFAVRFRADEFLLLLPSSHFSQSLQVAESVWREVRSLRWSAPGTGDVRVSVSGGISLFPSRDVRGKESLVQTAELALAQAKRSGADRVCVFQQQGLLYTSCSPSMSLPPPAPLTSKRRGGL